MTSIANDQIIRSLVYLEEKILFCLPLQWEKMFVLQIKWTKNWFRLNINNILSSKKIYL